MNDQYQRSQIEIEIEREWRIGQSVIPAMVSAEMSPLSSLPIVPGRGRTRYFYRKMAILLAQDSRRFEWVKGSRAVYQSLAKMYLDNYRKLCASGRGRT